MIIALPVGIAFFIFTCLYYYSSKKTETIIPSEKSRTDNESPHPDYHKLFNDSDYINEQENLR